MSQHEISLLILDIDGVLTDGGFSLDAEGNEWKSLSYRDLDALTALRRRGVELALVTAEDTPLARRIASRLGIERCVFGASDKLTAVREIAADMELRLDRVAYIADADRDAPALDAVGVALVPSDATPRARTSADVILRSGGGAGVVAEAAAALGGPVEHGAPESGGPPSEAQLEIVRSEIQSCIAVLSQVSDQAADSIVSAAALLRTTFEAGNRAYLFGNGGSAADAQHFAAELVGRFRGTRIGRPAIALTTDTSVLTSIANDEGYDEVFAAQLRALARPGDAAFGITTSGTSENVVAGLVEAKRIGLSTVALSGERSGQIDYVSDVSIKVPSSDTQRIQEAHTVVIHLLCRLI